LNFSLYIAKRYLFSKSANNAINIISRIASIGVVFGSILLLVVLSGFSGLKTLTLSYSSIVDPDFKITSSLGKKMYITEEQLTKLASNSQVVSFCKVVEEKVILEFKGKTEIATIKGVDVNYQNIISINSILSRGQWFNTNTMQTVVGDGLVNKLGLGIFGYSSDFSLIVPKPGNGQVNKNSFNKLTAYNVGAFNISEVDNNEYVYSSIQTAQELLSYDKNTITFIELKTLPDIDEQQLRNSLHDIFNDNISIKNKAQLNDAIYKMLNTENIAVYLIFTLILIIALFNVIGAIIMMIIDKKRDLITLSNLGTPINDIKKIFFLQGALFTLIGGSLGVLIGVLLVGSQLVFEFIKIPGTSITYPVELTLVNVFIVLSTIFTLGLIASKVASFRISKKMLSSN
jgi:lipoprotein-releasing system permease protein